MSIDLTDSLGRMGYSEEQGELARVAATFCAEKAPATGVRPLMDSANGFDDAVWREIAGLGWLGIAIPEDHGGAGLSLAETVPVAEQMGRRLMATPFMATTLAAQAILRAGDDGQKDRFLPSLADGSLIGTVAFGEPGDRLAALGASEQGGLMLDGRATLVEHAAAADLIVVKVGDGAKPRLAVLERATLPDGALRREGIIDETRRAYQLILKAHEVPGANVLPEAGTAAALTHVELAGALLMAAEMVGGAAAVIDYTADYLRTRTQFGRPIGSYQALKHPLVDAFLGHEKARSHLYAAAHSFADQGRGEVAVRMAKASAEAAYSYAADRAIQFHGGFGFTHDCDAGLHRRRAIWAASRFGDARTHRETLAELLF